MCFRLAVLLISFALLPLQAQEQQAAPRKALGALRNSGFPATARSVTIPINDTLLGFSVEVRINGKPVHLILDTGASVTILSAEAAEELGLKTMRADSRMVSSTAERVAMH